MVEKETKKNVNTKNANTTQFTEVLKNHTDKALEEVKAYWLSGEWEKLAELDIHKFADHPKRGHCALLIAAAYQQLGDQDKAKTYTCLALEWKCPQILVAKILIAGVHNTLGKIAALNHNKLSANYHFNTSITSVFGKNKKALYKRIYNELIGLNIIEVSDDIKIAEDFHNLSDTSNHQIKLNKFQKQSYS